MPAVLRRISLETDEGDLQMTGARRGSSTKQSPRARMNAAKRLQDADALVNLGSRLRDGYGVPRDLKLAKECFEAAVQLGEPTAMSSLGRWLLEFAEGTSQRRRAVALLRAAERRGEWSATYFLGRAAEDAGDWRQAERCYERALRAGDFASGARLASHYLGRLDARSHRKGVEILRRSAAHSDTSPDPVYLELGKCYLFGTGVPQSTEQARKYFTLASKTQSEAKEYLGRLSLSSVTGRRRRR